MGIGMIRWGGKGMGTRKLFLHPSNNVTHEWIQAEANEAECTG